MSWASDRLAFLNERYSYADISEVTGIPASTIGYVTRGERPLGAQYILNLRSFYTKTVYKELREAGASTYLARAYRYRSTASANEFLKESSSVIGQLADYIFEERKASHIRRGIFTSDADLRTELRTAISKSMARSPIDLGRHEGRDSPSIRHLVVVDEE